MTLPLLRLDGAPREAPGPVPAPETPQAARPETQLLEPGTAVQPAAPAPAVREAKMGTLLHCRIVLAHALRIARRHAKDLSQREGGWVNALLAAKPPSVNEQREYLRIRGWLPPGHEGGIADKGGTFYQRFIGIPGVTAGNAWSAVFARPFRLSVALAVLASVIALIWLVM
jgi:hypothetical protein